MALLLNVLFYILPKSNLNIKGLVIRIVGKFSRKKSIILSGARGVIRENKKNWGKIENLRGTFHRFVTRPKKFFFFLNMLSCLHLASHNL